MISKTYDIDEVMEQGRDFHIEARVSFCNVDGIQIEDVEITEWINDGSEEIKHGEDAKLLKMLRHRERRVRANGERDSPSGLRATHRGVKTPLYFFLF